MPSISLNALVLRYHHVVLKRQLRFQLAEPRYLPMKVIEVGLQSFGIIIPRIVQVNTIPASAAKPLGH